MAVQPRRRLVGNRLALAGAILYLLEWVGILAFNIGDVPGARGTTSAAILTEYTQHAAGIAMLASWLSIVLLGRILFVAAIRDGLRRSTAGSVWVDFSLGAMVVSVMIEIAAYAVAGGAVQAAAHADQSAVIGLDAAANWRNLVIIGPFAVAVLTGSLGMLHSHLFPRWLCWLGLAGGAVLLVDGLILGPAFRGGGSLFQASQLLQSAVLFIWVWMIATGVVLFRAAGRGREGES